MQKTPENGFTAKPCNFQGVNGYTMNQYIGGLVVCSQFVSMVAYEQFCQQAKITPLIIME